MKIQVSSVEQGAFKFEGSTIDKVKEQIIAYKNGIPRLPDQLGL